MTKLSYKPVDGNMRARTNADHAGFLTDTDVQLLPGEETSRKIAICLEPGFTAETALEDDLLGGLKDLDTGVSQADMTLETLGKAVEAISDELLDSCDHSIGFLFDRNNSRVVIEVSSAGGLSNDRSKVRGKPSDGVMGSLQYEIGIKAYEILDHNLISVDLLD